jgi:hypothetical protein
VSPIKVVGDPIPTTHGWRSRMALLPELDSSLCQVKRINEARGVSIGMFRPKSIDRLVIEPAEPWTEKQQAAVRQEHLGLDGGQAKHVATLEQIPWTFSYRFGCDEADCNGHKLQILDWENVQTIYGSLSQRGSGEVSPNSRAADGGTARQGLPY